MGTADVLQEHEEFVATESGHEVGRFERPSQTLRDLAQKNVAGRMAEAFVHQLEAVDVEGENRELVNAIDTVQRDGVIETIVERQPVGQPGQRIMSGLELQ